MYNGIMHFGEHLMIDGYGGSKNKLNNKEYILSLLTSIPKVLEMNVLAPPTVLFAAGNEKKDPGGWSGFVVIQESHISLHTFPERRFISADIYTCKNGLDTEKVLSLIVDGFECSDSETNFVLRGKKYPKQNI
jgi:S-adenosylmethionine decarboxylase